MNIGSAIRDLRKRKGLTQEELSAIAKISKNAMSSIENGARPSTETLKRLCKALDVTESLIYVYGMEKEDIPEGKRDLYDRLYPVIRNMVGQLAEDSDVLLKK